MNPYGRKFILVVLVLGVWYALYALFSAGISQTVIGCMGTPTGPTSGVIPTPASCLAVTVFGVIIPGPSWLIFSIMILKLILPLAIALIVGAIYLEKTKKKV